MFIKRVSLTAGFVLAGSVLAATTAMSQEVMRISSWLPPSHVNTEIFPTWIKWIEEATEGRVTGVVEFDLASPPAQIDLVTDGGADASWIFHGYNPGRFVTTKLIELPGYKGDAAASSVAHQRAYETYLHEAGEHEGVVVAAMMTHGPGQLFLRNEIDGLDGVKGLKVRIGGGVSTDMANALGMTGVALPAPEVYETVGSGVADGVMMPIDTNMSLRLYEVAPHTYKMPGGFYRGSFALILSEQFLDRLSPEDREAVLSTTGEKLALMAGEAWAKADMEGLKVVSERTTMHEFSEADQAKFAEAASSLKDQVITDVSGRGVDAEAALELIKQVMEEHAE